MKKRYILLFSSILTNILLNFNYIYVSADELHIEDNDDLREYSILENTSPDLKEETTTRNDSVLPSFREYEKLISPYAYDTLVIQEQIHTTNTNKTCADDSLSQQKIAFLTFDDGPSTTNTPKILNILDSNDIKATFFVVGSQLDSNKEEQELLKKLYIEGHAIGNHTYSHNYNYLYPSRYVNTTNIMKDLNKNESTVKKILGDDFEFNVVRMPGGLYSWKNNKALRKCFSENNIKFVDWNVLNGDAEGGNKNSSMLIRRFQQTYKNQNVVVILMHDTYGKDSTVTALPTIIQILKNDGYTFGILN